MSIFLILLIIYLCLEIFIRCLLQPNVGCKGRHIKTKTVLDSRNLDLPKKMLSTLFNPSICHLHDNTGYLLCIRESNCGWSNAIQMASRYISNFSNLKLGVFDTNFRIIKYISLDVPGYTILEDPRILQGKDNYYIIATIITNDGGNKPVLIEIDSKLNFTRVLTLKGDMAHREKNWTPFFYNGSFLFHTNAYPKWNIKRLNLDTGELTDIVDYESQNIFGHLSNDYHVSCSASPIIFNNRSILCLHVKSKKKNTSFGYYTLFCEMDKNTLLPLKVSYPICLDRNDHPRVIFASGLTQSLTDPSKLLISIGVSNNYFRVLSLSLDFL